MGDENQDPIVKYDTESHMHSCIDMAVVVKSFVGKGPSGILWALSGGVAAVTVSCS